MRASGILLPVFSLPSPYGIGSFGQSAYAFVDFLRASRQRYWQLLPLGPTSYGDSPYQSFSTFAGNPYFIDPDILKAEGLLTQSEIDAVPWPEDNRFINYSFLFEHRFPLLQIAYGRFTRSPEYDAFCEANRGWLPDYALYMALKHENRYAAWQEWPDALKRREPDALEQAVKRLGHDSGFHQFLQFMFYKQYRALKTYARRQGVRLIGDIPIYVAMDSADTWVHPSLFMLDESLTPVSVAGCPPDYFSKTGQLWGNPLYRWPAHEADAFAWWTERVKAAFGLFDIVRIDHFRGFASYYAIPFGDRTAQFGAWEQGPGIKLFRTLKEKLGPLNIIAEDLGFLTEDVFRLLREARYPGMKVLQFAFDARGESVYLPHRYPRKCVVYTGTHDNATTREWFADASRAERAFAGKYLALSKHEGYSRGFIRGAWASIADTAIAPMQDFLDLGAEARMNTPSTLGTNWRWRMKLCDLSDTLAAEIAEITSRYGRDRF